MSAIRFNFEREFDKPPQASGVFVSRPAEASIPISEHMRLIGETDRIATEAGFARGLDAARLEETARLANALEAMTHAIGEAAGRLAAIEDRASAEMTVMALTFARRLAGRLMDREPLQPIEEAARLAFQDLRGAPHIVARVAPELVEEVKRRLSRAAQEMGIDGKLIVMGEPEIATGDCRIEWADGGVVRSRAELDKRIASAVETALAQAQAQGAAQAFGPDAGKDNNPWGPNP
jgi:flagellar assembly protein FliH